MKQGLRPARGTAARTVPGKEMRPGAGIGHVNGNAAVVLSAGDDLSQRRRQILVDQGGEGRRLELRPARLDAIDEHRAPARVGERSDRPDQLELLLVTAVVGAHSLQLTGWRAHDADDRRRAPLPC
ncbi:MAG: hypothetical protein ACYTAQ_05085 [Planctomycetota bacterium]